MAAVAARTGVPLVEDDPYWPLRYAGQTLPSIKAFDEAGRVFTIGSFSKIIAPAMRLGWIVAPAAVLPKLSVLRESLDLESSQLLQRLLTEFVSRGCLEAHPQALNAANYVRRQAMRAALERELGGVASWTTPEGGLFLWVTLAEGHDAAQLLTAAFEQKVAYIPGANFSPHGLGANTLRLNYSNNTPARIAEGVRRLGMVLRERARA
jgi:2-aminoadipate transaminase